MQEGEEKFIPPSESPEKDRELTPKHDFDRNGWDYSRPSFEKFIQTIAVRLSVPESKLRDSLVYGGKAFGLNICESIAGSDSRIVVPRWEPIDKNNLSKYQDWDQKLQSEGGMLLARSSGPTEDWLDERSGNLPTAYFGNYRAWLTGELDFFPYKPTDQNYQEKLAEREKLRQTLLENPYIAQEEVVGFGVVVTFGYSEVLKKIVARVSSGREMGKGNFTSPTFDSESTSSLLDPESGEVLIPAATGHLIKHSLSDSPENRTLMSGEFNFGEFIRAMYSSVRKAGIDFGVQLEMNINPENLDRWNLLQIRPLPGKFRGDIESRTLPNERLLASSTFVNKVFDVSGEVETVGRSQESVNLAIEDLLATARDQSQRRTLLDARQGSKDTIQIFSSRIDEISPDVFSRITDDDGYVGISPEERPLMWLAGHQKGAIGQIVAGTIRATDFHGPMGAVGSDRGNDAIYDEVDLRIGQISLKPEEIERLLSERPKKIRIVSDGLVGQIFAVE